MDLAVMAMKGYSTFPKSLTFLELYHHGRQEKSYNETGTIAKEIKRMN